MLSLPALRDLRLTELTEAADGWRKVSGRAHAARQRIESEMMKPLKDTQVSEAATAAYHRLRLVKENFQYVYTECALIETALSGLATELEGPKLKLTRALEDAQQAGFTVLDDGGVGYPAAGTPDADGTLPEGGVVRGRQLKDPFRGPGGDYGSGDNPNEKRARAFADTIWSALKEAGEINDQYKRAIEKLKAEQGLKIDSSTWADVSGDMTAVHQAADDAMKSQIPLDKPPAERLEWWNGLDAEARTRLLAAYPDVIGNMDGIPTAVRDQANREYLPILMAKVEAKAAGDSKAQAQLLALREIDRKLKSGDVPPMFLIGIGDQGNGRAIVAFGQDPDTAKNVSTTVLGMNTALDEDFAKKDLKGAFDVASGARVLDPSSTSIVWLGYDAPQSELEAAAPSYAQKAAPGLNGFMNGLVATNQHGDPHLTVIGHSYGSLVVGVASQQPGRIPGADDIVLLGSPGVGVDRAEDLGVPKGRVWVGAAENDIVTHLPSKSGVGWKAGEVVQDIATGGPFRPVIRGVLDEVFGSDEPNDRLIYGQDPASKGFGANRIQSEAGPDEWKWTDPKIKPNTEAHGSYFDPETNQVSVDSISAIVADQPGKVSYEIPRGAHSVLVPGPGIRQ
ncbi:alpha/beta hydrolase [Streptomyces sp. NPDC085524]|uniref:alpha/beta hydrolase n=1 Tax=unclassified Streptomyces TaxID=2593676 RepID=UPI0035D7B350